MLFLSWPVVDHNGKTRSFYASYAVNRHLCKFIMQESLYMPVDVVHCFVVIFSSLSQQNFALNGTFSNVDGFMINFLSFSIDF